MKSLRFFTMLLLLAGVALQAGCVSYSMSGMRAVPVQDVPLPRVPTPVRLDTAGCHNKLPYILITLPNEIGTALEGTGYFRVDEAAPTVLKFDCTLSRPASEGLIKVNIFFSAFTAMMIPTIVPFPLDMRWTMTTPEGRQLSGRYKGSMVMYMGAWTWLFSRKQDQALKMGAGRAATHIVSEAGRSGLFGGGQ